MPKEDRAVFGVAMGKRGDLPGCSRGRCSNVEGRIVVAIEVAEGQVTHGQVKWFNNQKGYGFIVCEGVPDIFVHYTAIKMEGFRTLKQGEEVDFELLKGAKGLQAINVVPSGSPEGETADA